MPIIGTKLLRLATNRDYKRGCALQWLLVRPAGKMLGLPKICLCEAESNPQVYGCIKESFFYTALLSATLVGFVVTGWIFIVTVNKVVFRLHV